MLVPGKAVFKHIEQCSWHWSKCQSLQTIDSLVILFSFIVMMRRCKLFKKLRTMFIFLLQNIFMISCDYISYHCIKVLLNVTTCLGFSFCVLKKNCFILYKIILRGIVNTFMFRHVIVIYPWLHNINAMIVN